MKYKKTLALIPAMLLAACGGDEQTSKPKVETEGLVIYSYPADGQTGISPVADIVIRFSDAITDSEAALQGKILVTDDSGPVSFSVTKVDGGRSLKLSPYSRFTPGTEYTVTFSDPLLAQGSREIITPNAVGDEGIQFTIRGAFSGLAGLDNLSDDFQVAQLIPSPDGLFQPVTFSTFRLTMSHPVHPDWQDMGAEIRLKDSLGNTVPATVLVNGPNITIDPCVLEDAELCGTKNDALEPGQSYTIQISGLPSLTKPGATLDFSQSFIARDPGSTVILYQEVLDSGLGEGLDADDAAKSPLNDQIINGVTLNSVLQGIVGPSQQTGGLYAELAYIPSFSADEPIPLRIPKGSLLTSSSLDLRIAGSVPVIDPTTGLMQTTGDIKVTLLSDATGYLSPNSYTDDLSAPRHVTLYMDVSMNTEESQPNAALSQDLMAIELSGMAIVEDGSLVIDAIAIVEPHLLGLEYTDSTIAFHIEASTDVDSVLDAQDLWTADTTSPQLLSWMPGSRNTFPATRQSMQRPGDPIILNYDEPLDPDSARTGITLLEDGIAVSDLKTRVDGTAVVITPANGLKLGHNYRVQVNGLSDIAGNPAITPDMAFDMVAIDTDTPSVLQRSPIALTTYPGFPCATDESEIDLVAGTHGHCTDAAPSGSGGGDLLPVDDMPEDRPITVVFSQPMDVDSIRLGETFVVRKVNSDTTLIEEVSGRLEKNKNRIRFYPDQPWEQGSFYSYTLVSASNGTCSAGSKPVICGDNGLALQTDILEDSEDTGGDPLSIYFRGAAATDMIYAPLRNLPVRDTNANYVIDCAPVSGQDCLEPFAHESDGNGGYLASANSSGLAIDPGGITFNIGALPIASTARIGCSASGEDCPENKFIYETVGLNTQITGPKVDPETGKQGVGVLLYPMRLITSSVDVYISLPDVPLVGTLLEGLAGPLTASTNPMVLRMRYAKDDPSCTSNCARSGLIPGVIIEGDDGVPLFKTSADVFLDAPNLSAPLGATHNIYSMPFTLNLEGPVEFLDDGRMQIIQRNTTSADLNATASLAAGAITIDIPLAIPVESANLTFISNPVKEIPVVQ